MRKIANDASYGKSEGISPRERILSAASGLFYRHGIRAVGVEAIAEEAKTNKMTLYRHFTSKDELVAQYL
jgi:AcrR family transcriptional regulator